MSSNKIDVQKSPLAGRTSDMPSPTITPGRLAFVLSNLFYFLGAFLADFSETHVYNPTWPPHAKFHNGQTMTLSGLLALTSIYLAFAPADSPTQQRRNVFLAAVVGSFYCGAGLSAILYPGTDWADPDYPGGGAHGGQFYVFAVQVIANWAAYALEVGRLQKGKAA